MADKVILCFGKQEGIKNYLHKIAIDPFAVYYPIYNRHEFMGKYQDREVECVHCGSWDSQTYNLYLEAIAYYKKVPINN